MDLEKLKLTPLKKVIHKLERSLVPIKKEVFSNIDESVARVLTEDVVSKLDNPPFENSAIDGYAIKIDEGIPQQSFKILKGRSTPGKPFNGTIKTTEALRVLTGAKVPSGTNKIIFDEEVSVDGDILSLNLRNERSSNIRLKGEDIKKGQIIFNKGYSIKETDMPALIASGNSQLSTYSRLRVGLLKTGTEIEEKKLQVSKTSILDANGPPLTALFNKWGFEVVQLGNIKDNLEAIKDKLNKNLNNIDVIVTTGGASSGEEDFISKLLLSEGEVYAWKVAIKPGRPIIMGSWEGKHLFGLPGNPVAAFVCALIFLRPSLGRIAGEKSWFKPLSFKVGAAFEKSKKIGRTEFLRGRLEENNTVSVFPFEGSGRLTSLAWSNGLVRIEDNISNVEIGDKLNFIPYSCFG